MRIIKLSDTDPDMKTVFDVRKYFKKKLQARKLKGQFLLTATRIKEGGVEPGEKLVFTYRSQLVFSALAASGRIAYEGEEASEYPYYFCIDTSSIRQATRIG